MCFSVHDSGAGLTDGRKAPGRRALLPRAAPCRDHVRLGPRTVDRQRLHLRQWRQGRGRERRHRPRHHGHRSICRCRGETATNWRPPSMSEIPASVLVVDDEVQIRRFLRTGFELDGFMVQEAETGAEALRTATLQPSDLVILDLGLPDMDGADVLERLRSWSSVPLIVLSVRGQRSRESAAVGARRRRLCGQAVRHGGAVGAGAFGDAAAIARLARRAGGEIRTAVDRFRRARRVHQRPARHADARRNTGCCRSWRSIPAMSSPTSSCCAKSGATSTSTTPITCASSCASCAARSRPTRPSRASSSPSSASATGW